MEAMLTLNPNKRITAKEALQHPYFSEQPPPVACMLYSHLCICIYDY